MDGRRGRVGDEKETRGVKKEDKKKEKKKKKMKKLLWKLGLCIWHQSARRDRPTRQGPIAEH